MPTTLVAANYVLRDTMNYTSEQAAMKVYSNGTSDISLLFTYSARFDYTFPDGSFMRLIKADSVEGNFGQGDITVVAQSPTRLTQFSSTISFDRAFDKCEYLTFAICKADGSELHQLKYKLNKFDSADGKWPKPDSTPPVPTIPPVQPTPTPTPRPTLAPDATEPPQDSALFSVKYRLREYTADFTEMSAILRVYDEMSSLSVQFKYAKEIAEGTTMRFSMADGKQGIFGEVPITTLADGTKQVTYLFNQQVGTLRKFNLDAYAPNAQVRSFKAWYTLNGRSTPADWGKMDPIATLPPAATATPPAAGDAEPTPAPTAPPQKQKTSTTNYGLLDPVKYLTMKRAAHSRYDADLSVLQLQFLYDGELPAKAWIRITHREYSEGNFGQALIERGEDGLLTATIVTDQLQGSLRGFRLKCINKDGKELFYADFYPRLYGDWDGGTEASMARSFLPTATPKPSETPIPTPVVVQHDEAPETTAAPTEPPYNEARSKRKFLPVDQVKKYSNYNTTLRRYEEFDVLTVNFRYSEKLPKGTILRLVRVDHWLDNFGEAPILPSKLENAGSGLLCATIVSDRIPLNCAGLRLEAVTPDGTIIFQADYYPDVKGFSADKARKILSTTLETPSPSESPPPSP